MHVTTQYSIEQNIRMESLHFDPREFYPRPDALEMKLVIPKILIEVETALVKSLREGLYNMIKNCDTSMSYNAAKFKSTNMKQSELSPATIEAALSHIIEHLDQYPHLIEALGIGKIGYHDKCVMLNDMRVRMLVIKGSNRSW